MLGDLQVGIYQSVFKIVALTVVAPEILVATMMPVLSRMHDENEERWYVLSGLLIKTLFFLGLPLGMTLFVFSEQIIHMVYGTATFAEAVPIMRLFAFTVFIRFSVEAFALMLTTSHRQSVRMKIVVAGTFINLGLNLYMIPRFGPYGAGIVSLATNAVVGAAYLAATQKGLWSRILNLRNFVPFLVTLLISSIMWNMRSFSMWYTFPLAIAAYAIVFYFVGYSKAERSLILSRDNYIPVAS
jgi:O-antigen/teichoic acid export membrane protein